MKVPQLPCGPSYQLLWIVTNLDTPLQVMELGRDLEGFSALVYSNFEEDVSQRDLNT